MSQSVSVIEACPAVPATTSEPVEKPLAVNVIERKPGWRFIDLAELWRYRELLLFLIWRDIKVRYKQTAVGAAWALLQPLATMGAFSMFLGKALAQGGAEIPYPVFIFAGLLPWMFFANCVQSATMSIVANHNLITKVYFPRLLVPLGTMGVCVVDFAISAVVLAGLMLGYGIAPSWEVLLAPVVLLLLLIGTAGLGIMLAAVTVEFRDFRHIVPFMVQIGMFATPAVYLQSTGVLSPWMQELARFNPLHGLIVNFRAALLGTPFDWPALAVSAAMSVTLLLVACFYFRRAERRFADII